MSFGAQVSSGKHLHKQTARKIMCCAVQNETIHVISEKALLLETINWYINKGSHVIQPLNRNSWILPTIQSLQSEKLRRFWTITTYKPPNTTASLSEILLTPPGIPICLPCRKEHDKCAASQGCQSTRNTDKPAQTCKEAWNTPCGTEWFTIHTIQLIPWITREISNTL